MGAVRFFFIVLAGIFTLLAPPLVFLDKATEGSGGTWLLVLVVGTYLYGSIIAMGSRRTFSGMMWSGIVLNVLLAGFWVPLWFATHYQAIGMAGIFVTVAWIFAIGDRRQRDRQAERERAEREERAAAQGWRPDR